MSANDPYQWIEDELKLMRQAIDERMPIMGHCLGSQLISRALGGTVRNMPENEIGWHPVTAVDNAIGRAWLGDTPEDLPVLAWHHDEFSLPAGATHILKSQYCKNHAFVVDNILATVAHVEVTVSMLKHWLKKYGHDINPNGGSVQAIDTITDDVENKVATMYRLTDRIYDKWLGFLSVKGKP
jgi:GMP synthase-like glutamine amidotransferase